MGIHIVGEAADGKSALVKIRELRPQILLTDVVMPGMNGIELIRTVREEGIALQIVLLSAFQNFEYVKSALKYDAIDYLLKPFNHDELKQVMDKVLLQIQHTKGKVKPNHESKGNKLSRDEKLVEQIRVYIDAHYQHKLTIQDIADHVHLSVNHIAGLFKKETGQTIFDYITSVRISTAKQLLDNPIYKIYEIADRTGYPDANYFTKVFKKYTGLSPKEYRDESI